MTIGGRVVVSFLHAGTHSSVPERARRVTELLNVGLVQIAPQGGGPFNVHRVYLAKAKGNPVIMMGTTAVLVITSDDAKRHKTTQRALANRSLKQMRLALQGIYR